MLRGYLQSWLIVESFSLFGARSLFPHKKKLSRNYFCEN